jgi:serine/threonine protein kinase
MECERCKAPIVPPAAYCPSCGYPVPTWVTADAQPTQPDATQPLHDVQANGGRGDGSTIPPSLPSSAADEERVAALLQGIAAQSHFEERYQMRGILDSGGMGEIYRAYDLILRREVAVKMMREGLSRGHASSAVRAQFLKEARVGGRLLHPNVLAVFDLGVNRQSQVYYTMRLVHGASLHECLRSLARGVATRLIQLPLRKLVETFAGACRGVAYAHEHGILHLDLKPQNVLVSGFEEVFVIDWGLARVDNEDDSELLADLYRQRPLPESTASHTRAMGGHVVGTPAYMAPEQAAGDASAFTHATDVFGLGGILYYMLYGEAPNRGDTPWEMMAAAARPKQPGRLRDGILPQGRRVPRALERCVAGLQEICLKSLRPLPADRYADVNQLLIDVNEWLAESAEVV